MDRSEFLVVWGLVIIAISLLSLSACWLGVKVFRGATVIAPRAGETQEDAEARADKIAWRVVVPLVAVTGLLCYAFIVWQSTVLY
ncbi:MAG TPA: hypothetical protein VMT27_03470 [Actinomycetes bacterium]|nr:hypothetical protein [Actinomycetes bacterium]